MTISHDSNFTECTGTHIEVHTMWIGLLVCVWHGLLAVADDRRYVTKQTTPWTFAQGSADYYRKSISHLFACCMIHCKHLRLSDANKRTYLLTYLLTCQFVMARPATYRYTEMDANSPE